MTRVIEVKCHTCGHSWYEDLDEAQAQKVIYRGEKKKTRVETYSFKCPRDGTYVAVDVEIEA